MTIETVRTLIKARLVAAAVLVVSLCAAAGYAQPSFAGRFTLPYEVNWGKTVLRAGNYQIIIDQAERTTTVESADGKIRFFTTIPIPQDSKGGTTGLIVVLHGNERFVRALNLPHNGMSLVYQPATPAEREMLAKADGVDTVPLLTGSK
jgi:hypothetical protein